MDSVVRISRPQPTSPVSVGDVRFAKIGATFPQVSEALRNLCGAIFWILGDIRPIARAGLWSPIFNIRVWCKRLGSKPTETGSICLSLARGLVP